MNVLYFLLLPWLCTCCLSTLAPPPRLHAIPFLSFSWETPASTSASRSVNNLWVRLPEPLSHCIVVLIMTYSSTGEWTMEIVEGKELRVGERTLASVSEEMGFKWTGFVLYVLKILARFLTFLKLHMYNGWHTFGFYKWRLSLCGINKIPVITRYSQNIYWMSEFMSEWVSEWMTNTWVFYFNYLCKLFFLVSEICSFLSV